MASIYESCTDDDYDEGYMITDALEDIQDGNYIHLEIRARYAR